MQTSRSPRSLLALSEGALTFSGRSGLRYGMSVYQSDYSGTASITQSAETLISAVLKIKVNRVDLALMNPDVNQPEPILNYVAAANGYPRFVKLSSFPSTSITLLISGRSVG